MPDLTDTLEQLLDAQAGQIGARIGADEAQTRQAMHAAIPALMAALGQEAERDESGLRQAIERDHDGAILDQLTDYLGGTAQLDPRTTNGAGILDHALGDRQPELARALSAKSGLDLGSIMQLLPLLAPILMGMLGKKGRAGGTGGFSLDDLGGILGQEREAARSKDPDIGDILDSFTGGGTSSRGSASPGSASGKSGGGLMDAIGDMLGGKDR